MTGFDVFVQPRYLGAARQGLGERPLYCFEANQALPLLGEGDLYSCVPLWGGTTNPPKYRGGSTAGCPSIVYDVFPRRGGSLSQACLSCFSQNETIDKHSKFKISMAGQVGKGTRERLRERERKHFLSNIVTEKPKICMARKS